MILRNFLYLDNNMMEDYLSALDGYLIEEQNEIKTNSYANDVGGDVKFLKGDMSTTSETKVDSKKAITYAAKFQKLYDLMAKNTMLRCIDEINEKIWREIHRSDIIEIDVNIEIAKSFNNFKGVKDAVPMLDLLQTMGAINSNNPNDIKAIQAISKLCKMVNTNKVPIICKNTTSEEYKFYGALQQDYLKNDISELEGNVTIIGKVQKILEKDVSDEIYNPLSNYKELIELGKKENAKDNKAMENIIENVYGPAIKLIPLAIYT